MRSLLTSSLLILASALFLEAYAAMKAPCAAFGRICDCAWQVRDCLPVCHLEPQIECTPARWTAKQP